MYIYTYLFSMKVGEMEKFSIGFKSTTERIETSTAAGRLVFHVFAALAEL